MVTPYDESIHDYETNLLIGLLKFFLKNLFLRIFLIGEKKPTCWRLKNEITTRNRACPRLGCNV